ncbi:YcgJ family protein [Yersinia nurmii]|uniref:YcgJ family protein n=1 Tax=Yersinia nurmii TaxID=685706 RepID=A0AAW7K977_9GAMM|nr:YcgJ family protein [Yersinia nurmii]MDN0088295.1 YcgJ family protein [Yersinia nurmii]
MNKSLAMLVLSLGFVAAYADAATTKNRLQSPTPGVVCDKYVCADAKNGISVPLTERYLGKKKSQRLASQGDFDRTQFTFVNGIFCDVKERLCRKDRYYGVDGKHSGAIDEQTTELLFGQNR